MALFQLLLHPSNRAAPSITYSNGSVAYSWLVRREAVGFQITRKLFRL